MVVTDRCDHRTASTRRFLPPSPVHSRSRSVPPPPGFPVGRCLRLLQYFRRTVLSVVTQAAGLVASPMAAAATGFVVVEVLPDLRSEGHLPWMVVGLNVGVAVPLTLGACGRRLNRGLRERAGAAASALPMRFAHRGRHRPAHRRGARGSRSDAGSDAGRPAHSGPHAETHSWASASTSNCLSWE